MMGYMCPSCSWFGPNGSEPPEDTPDRMMVCAHCGYESSVWHFWYERRWFAGWTAAGRRRGSRALIDPKFVWRKWTRAAAADAARHRGRDEEEG